MTDLGLCLFSREIELASCASRLLKEAGILVKWTDHKDRNGNGVPTFGKFYPLGFFRGIADESRGGHGRSAHVW